MHNTVGVVDTDEESTCDLGESRLTSLESALASWFLTPKQVQVRADRYQYPVGCALRLQEHELRKLSEDQRP